MFSAAIMAGQSSSGRLSHVVLLFYCCVSQKVYTTVFIEVKREKAELNKSITRIERASNARVM